MPTIAVKRRCKALQRALLSMRDGILHLYGDSDDDRELIAHSFATKCSESLDYLRTRFRVGQLGPNPAPNFPAGLAQTLSTFVLKPLGDARVHAGYLPPGMLKKLEMDLAALGLAI